MYVIDRSMIPAAVCCGWLFVAGFVGCGGDAGPARQPATGTVSLDGQPLSDATIVFEPLDTEGTLASTAIVGGRFEWTKQDGPPAGRYHVRINPDGVEEEIALSIMQSGKRQPLERVAVPLKYQRPGTLSAEVVADGTNEFQFALQSR